MNNVSANTVPVCTDHRKPMVMGKYGSYYCQTKVGDAWCKIKYYPPDYVKKADREKQPAFPTSNQPIQDQAQPVKVSQDDKWAFLMDKLADIEEKINAVDEHVLRLTELGK